MQLQAHCGALSLVFSSIIYSKACGRKQKHEMLQPRAQVCWCLLGAGSSSGAGEEVIRKKRVRKKEQQREASMF